MFEKYRAKRQLKKAREDLQTIYDESQRRKEFVHDKYRPAEDYLNSLEAKVYREIMEEEYWLSTFLKELPQWGTPKALYKGDPDSPSAYTRVKEDRSTKMTYEYIPEADMIATIINGKWSSDKWKWRDVENFKREGWGRPAEFNDYLKRFHDAKTPEDTEEVLAEYRSKYPNAIY